jgi:FkbM family methyltransferase
MKYYIKKIIRFWVDYFCTCPFAIRLASLILWRVNVKGIRGGCSHNVLNEYVFVDFSKSNYIEKRFLDYFQLKPKNELMSLKHNLLQGMDELSHDTVDRFFKTYEIFTDINQYFADQNIFNSRCIYCVPLCAVLSEREKLDIERWNTKALTRERHNCYKLSYFTDDLYDTFIKKRSLAYIDSQYWQFNGHDVLDCGANIGQAALVFSELSGVRTIHSFEPARETFRTLVKTIKRNKKEGFIIPVNMATSNECGRIRLYSNNMNDEDTSVLSDTKKSYYEVEMITIDEYVRSHNLEVGIIKLDVEGAEYATILGATETIKKSKPILLISIYHTPKDFFEIKPYLEGLNLGYNFMIRQTQYRVYCEGYELLAYVTQ